MTTSKGYYMVTKFLTKYMKWILLAAILGLIAYLLSHQCHCQPPKSIIGIKGV